MKQLLLLPVAVFILGITSCNTQRLVVKVNDAKKLETYKDNFIGKPLKNLLAEIKPEIKFLYGNPENTWREATGGTYFTFYFLSKEEVKKRFSPNNKPTRIFVQFQLEPINKRKLLPNGSLSKWTKKETKEYGDMIIMNIRVSGEN